MSKKLAKKLAEKELIIKMNYKRLKNNKNKVKNIHQYAIMKKQ
jgi:hypothetical protein